MCLFLPPSPSPLPFARSFVDSDSKSTRLVTVAIVQSWNPPSLFMAKEIDEFVFYWPGSWQRREAHEEQVFESVATEVIPTLRLA